MKKIIIFSVLLIIAILWLDFFTKSWTYFFLDTIFYPIYKLNNFFSQSFYWHIRDILTILLGYKLYAKLYLIWVLITWIFLWYFTAKLINKIFNINNKKIILLNKTLAIIFILFNPFIYERLVTQTWIALWVFFIWLWFIFLIDYLYSFSKNKKNRLNKKLYLSSLFFWISFTIFPHSIIFIIIIWIITLLFYYKKFTIKNIFYSILIILLLNINWIIWTLFLWKNETIQRASNFSFQNIEVFTSKSLSWLWIEITNLLLYWFWWELPRHLLTPDLINKKWFIWWFFILFIIILWIYFLYKKQKKLTFYLLSIWILSYILSLWISSDIFKNINLFLYNNIPYYKGMREAQKLTWLVAIIYSIFFLSWIYFIIQKYKRYKLQNYLDKKLFNYSLLFIFIFLIIISWSPNMLFWFRWQLKIIDYPKEYFNSREFLLKNYKNDKNLVLPWHSYIYCSWSKKIIPNPIKPILEPLNVISADNIEIWNLYTNSTNERSKKIEKFLKNKDFNILKKLWIKNIIFLNNCADYKSYKYLENKKNLIKIFDKNNLKIYKIK